ncbi:hypothetical protein WR25_23733 isoform B [Diploscapter pachys]|uniref:tRNA (uracil(54)-C(5))-methyltransferase n=1 Tax=Diploscapter pachys TaxID=2018661 RepID=A0A2A2JFD8_9BILA|nr:hypothetical protein WR25_23733 isoform A [Diploscapter pachys]PAV60395.1 hypothetical protein WR25_23733 isoform B [Diploscapter pachys]
MKFRKLTLFHRKAYVSCHSHENAQKVIGIINGMVIKKLQITAKLAATEPTKRILQKLHTTLSQAKVGRLPRKNEFPDILKPIRSSPRTKNYRNKCEFTVGRNKESEICVGFVGGRFSDNEYFILPIGDVEHIGSQAKEIAKDFEGFVKESDLPPFDEFKRVGVWRSLTVREFACDVMLIVNVFPIQDKDKEREAKEKLKERYLTLRSFKEQKFRVTSLYWMDLVSNHDQTNAEHLGGTEHVYETVLNCRFRISPLAFFQTNTAGTNVLYDLIGKACGFEKYLKPSEDEKPAPLNPEAEDPPVKLMKVDENSKMEIEPEKKKDLLLLDICCGTGTIGICILKEYIKKLDRKLFCIGVEIVESAIQDAKKNAKDNLLEKDW